MLLISFTAPFSLGVPSSTVAYQCSQVDGLRPLQSNFCQKICHTKDLLSILPRLLNLSALSFSCSETREPLLII
ncbi:hypothetical protein IW262DRAFT_1413802 [Armillaria fumosa]|nr:hypothetical protein IW262DRAFT_1413802 [Armillaria fumosa]